MEITKTVSDLKTYVCLNFLSASGRGTNDLIVCQAISNSKIREYADTQLIGGIMIGVQEYNNRHVNGQQRILVYHSPVIYINPLPILYSFAGIASSDNNTKALNNELNANEDQLREMTGFKLHKFQFYNRQNDIFLLPIMIQIACKNNELFVKLFYYIICYAMHM